MVEKDPQREGVWDFAFQESIQREEEHKRNQPCNSRSCLQRAINSMFGDFQHKIYLQSEIVERQNLFCTLQCDQRHWVCTYFSCFTKEFLRGRSNQCNLCSSLCQAQDCEGGRFQFVWHFQVLVMKQELLIPFCCQFVNTHHQELMKSVE